MIKTKRLIWQLYPSYLLIILISLGAVSWFASKYLRQIFLERTVSSLKVQGQVIENQIAMYLSPLDTSALDYYCKETGKAISSRITVLLPDGKVIADSDLSPEKIENQIHSPDIRQALTRDVGVAIEYNRSLLKKMIHVSLPIHGAENRLAILRISIPQTTIDEELRDVQIRIFYVGLMIALLASGICYYVSHRISYPIEQMKQGAIQFAKGDAAFKLPTPRTREIAGLVDALNHMALQLRARIQAVTNQRNEYEAVLSSMTEGVIAVDMNENILGINQAASDIFGTDPDNAKDRSIQEIIRNQDFNRFVEKAHTNGTSLQGDVVLHRHGEKILSICASPLRDAGDKRIGTLLVINDVTQLRRLEDVRQDFVANVSHEIKTPLTAIKGFVETLRHGALSDPEEADRFLEIIERHVNRLGSIIDDLLQLSRIEQSNNGQNIQMSIQSISDVIQSSIQICQNKAEEKNIAIDVFCEDDYRAKIDRRLFEQALINLVDNAVKYSRENSEITIHVENSGSELIIEVHDQGIGISKAHQPRIFERFYRVDKARSRKMGGTGLGLAIVKHIVSAHGGYLTVESALGKGSTFSIHLPVGDSGTTRPLSSQ